jgi:hypothetical protein
MRRSLGIIVSLEWAMEIVWDESMLKRYVTAAVDVSQERPILIDKFLEMPLKLKPTPLLMVQMPLYPL